MQCKSFWMKASAKCIHVNVDKTMSHNDQLSAFWQKPVGGFHTNIVESCSSHNSGGHMTVMCNLKVHLAGCDMIWFEECVSAEHLSCKHLARYLNTCCLNLTFEYILPDLKMVCAAVRNVWHWQWSKWFTGITLNVIKCNTLHGHFSEGSPTF